ncbi:DUF429 domain-containing protein [Agrococcus sp. HG114]|uniref:DUF429 domain-containing protein n=1 Tax=Agrococcus sp. HG114 TaxID=2969757 RepID=UPI00215AED1D|nr:DUF429 domain-containing protein [Agrococcus sp. HG114]MCR8669584.1 DUF429 domain-containing protein [Agrococcus sp. HG114]
MSVTVGVDLASQPSKSALAKIEWTAGGASLVELTTSCSDEVLLRHIEAEDGVLAIDCPFGWPRHFTELLIAHRDGVKQANFDEPFIERRTLRATDIYVRAATSMTPLRVSADRIAFPALRLARVFAAARQPIARDGSGRVVEAYPAAALNLWGLPFRNYKRTEGLRGREAIVCQLEDAAPWLDLASHRTLLIASDDALDAVACALVARAAQLGLTHMPEDRDVALEEGWIHLPSGSLDDLRPDGEATAV